MNPRRSSTILRTAVAFVACIVTLIRVTSTAPLQCSSRHDAAVIMRGEVVRSPDDYPWLVLLWITCKDEGSITTCAGVLVADNWVLTYAGCFCPGKSSSVVDVGLYNSDIRSELEQGRHVERMSVENVFSYPTKQEGVAIARLRTSVQDTSRILMLASCGEDNYYPNGKQALSTGWGSTPTKTAIDPKPLHEVWMQIMSEDSCESGMICAGGNNYTNDEERPMTSAAPEESPPCYAQKGSPLVVQHSGDSSSFNSACEWRLYGVLARGLTCDNEPDTGIGSPGIFVNVCQYHKWIEEKIEEENTHAATRIACPSLPEPPLNGYLCTRGSEHVGRTEMVHFCCNKGYEISGNSTASCNAAVHRWEPATPLCLPVQCPLIPTPINGWTMPQLCAGSHFQSNCWFSCHMGYHLSGPGLLTCNMNGKWSSLPPNCEVTNCGPPPAAQSLTVRYSSRGFGATAEYTCNKCFRMADGLGNITQTISRVCNEQGTWTGPLPICEAVQCPAPVSPLHGTVSQSAYLCGARVRFYCDPGFDLIGQHEVKCMGNEEWSHPTPTCSSISCPTPNIPNSNFKTANGSHPYGSTVTIKCDSCRALADDEEGILKCTENGHWDKRVPSCKWITCPLLGFLDHGTISPLGQNYFCKTTVDFECDEGYMLQGPSNSTCQDNGTWSNNYPTCQEIFCPEVSLIPHAILHQSGRRPNDVLNISCNMCYSLSDSLKTSLRCLSTGSWESSFPECKLVMCPRLHPLKHGLIQPSPLARTCQEAVTFSCENGFTMNGSETISCDKDGKWSSEQPTCEIIQCAPPPTPTPHCHICSNHSSPIPTHFSATLNYCCEEGYMMEDGYNKLLRCTEQGIWDDAAPICNAIFCAPPQRLSDGFILEKNGSRLSNFTKELIYGTRLVFNCNEGFIMLGNNQTMCEEEGWSHKHPICSKLQCIAACQPPVAPENGKVVNILKNGNDGFGVGSVIRLGAEAVYICNSGFYLHGSGSRTCKENSVWSGQEPLCLTFAEPRSRVIFRDQNSVEQWVVGDTVHILPRQPLYMACQTYREEIGTAQPIVKRTGPPLDGDGVRIQAYGNPARSTQLVLKARTIEAGRTLAGVYVCEVQSKMNSSISIIRTLTVHVHDHLCPQTGNLSRNAVLTTAGTIPGSCQHYECSRGFSLFGPNNRHCLADGIWSHPSPLCLSDVHQNCAFPLPIFPATITPQLSEGELYSTGTTITYHCPPTHTLTGPSSQVCLGGDWSGSMPSCVELSP